MNKFTFKTIIVTFLFVLCLSLVKQHIYAQSASHNSAEEFLKQGEVFAENKEYDKAIEQYDLALQINPKYAEAYNDRGHSYFWRFGQGDNERAIADYLEAIKLRPNYPNAHNNLGVAYMTRGSSDKAVPEFSEAIRLDPSFRYAYINRASAELRVGRFFSAFADFHKAGMYPERKPVLLVGVILITILILLIRRKQKKSIKHKLV